MGLFEEVSQFLETRLEEFLRNNPHLELEALQEQLRGQERDTLQLITDLERQKKKLEADILSVAEQIQTWHGRIAMAKQKGRDDLAQAAQEREAALLRQGNQLWGQMEGVKKRIIQSQELFRQIQQRRKEVRQKAAEVKATQETTPSQTASSWDTTGWNQGRNYQTYNRGFDDLESEFERLELDEELEQIKRKM